ncbi:hypothetical protein PQX77_002097 [Marasmius sp. AFHP31]|nr:hypothetical protein PQX77_002097 [Marasmius sp. AFHP31]
MHCIRYPLPDSLFYWATDPEGKHLIPEEQWERYEIPELKVRTWIGSYWDYYEYNSVKDHLLRKNYGSDGKQYARDHGCPELIPDDPHQPRMEEPEDSVSDEEYSDKDQEYSKNGNDPESSANNRGSENSDQNKSSRLDHRFTSPSWLTLRHTFVKRKPMVYSGRGGVLNDQWMHERQVGTRSSVNTLNPGGSVCEDQVKKRRNVSQKPFPASTRTPRGSETGGRAIDLPNSSKTQTPSQRTIRPAGSTKGTPTPAQCSRLAFAATEEAEAKTTKIPLSSMSTGKIPRSTQPQTIQKETIAPDPQRKFQTTEQQAIGSVGANAAKPVIRKPTPSWRSLQAGKPPVVPKETEKQPNAEQESENTTGLVKHGPIKVTSAALRATRSQMTHKNDSVKKEWR